MKKNIKLISSLFLLTTFGIAVSLPIVSCSTQSGETETKEITVSQSIIPEKKDQIILAIKKIGNPNATNTNSEMDYNQFNKIIKEHNSNQKELWIALNDFFTFVGEDKFDKVVESVIISGKYPDTTNTNIVVSIELKINSYYKITNPNELILNNLIIGQSTSSDSNIELTVNKSNDINLIKRLSLEIAKIGNKQANSEIFGMKIYEFNKILNSSPWDSNFDSIFLYASKIFTFRNSYDGNVRDFNSVVDSISIENSNYGVDSENILLSIKINLKNSFIVDLNNAANLELSNIVIGIPKISKLSVDILNPNNDGEVITPIYEKIGVGIAKIIDSNINSNTTNINQQMIDKIYGKTYLANDPIIDFALTYIFQTVKFLDIETNEEIIVDDKYLKSITLKSVLPNYDGPPPNGRPIPGSNIMTAISLDWNLSKYIEFSGDNNKNINVVIGVFQN